MATIKQCKMMAARARAVGVSVDWDSLTQLENGQVDEFLANLPKTKPVQALPTQADIERSLSRVNQPRFGMACKLVLESSDMYRRPHNHNDFANEVIAMYRLINDTELVLARQIASPSLSPP